MKLLCVISTLCAFSTGASALFGATKVNGKSQLFGNNFGVLNVNATYDYVVVGGGLAGLTIGSRLALESNYSVAVIEAGGFYEIDNGNISQVPGLGGGYLTFNNLAPSPVLVDWDMITEPQPGLVGRRQHYVAGKTLGGGSSLNDMTFHRTVKGAYEQWANATGDDSYLWDNFLPYLKKSVHFNAPPRNSGIAYDPKVYSPTGGPLQLSFSSYTPPFDKYLSKALNTLGLKALPGLNSGVLNGYAQTTLSITSTEQIRSSASSSFLQAALDTSTLRLYLRTLAHKILFDSNKTATGVLVETNGAQYILSANKEVIVSAGALHSPQLLKLSGIGPAAELEKFDIPVISDLPGVGQNLRDHVFIYNSFEFNITTGSGVVSNPELAAQATQEYLYNQSGPYTSIGGSVIGWEKIPDRSQFTPEVLDALEYFPADFPEIEILSLAPGTNPLDQPLANNFNSVAVSILGTLSRGNVQLNGTDANVQPILHINALEHPADLALAVASIKRVLQIVNATGVFKAAYNPGSDVQTDAEIEQWVRENAVNGFHACGTCAMGKATDPNAVLDSHARVLGVTGLRVVDASSFPTLPAGHTMSSVYALSEKIATDILT